MSGRESQQEQLNVRMQNIRQDMEMVEAQAKRLEEKKALLIIKLVSTREKILAEKEQDE